MTDLQNDQNQIFRYFNFPPEIQTACVQFLIYFTEILTDIGLEASTEVKTDSDGVKFIVISESEDNYIDVISRILDIYLELPSHNDLDHYIGENKDEQSILHLKSQIKNLRTQYYRALMENEAQSSTIDVQKSIIEYQRDLINELRLGQYQIPQKNESSEETESIIPGVVNVGTLKWKGFEINLANLMKMLKRKFRNRRE